MTLFNVADELAASERHLGALIDAAGETFGDAPLFGGSEPLSFRSFAAQTRRVARRLSASSFARGDRLLLVAHPSAALLSAAFAACRLGGAFTILHPDTTAASLQRASALLAPRLLVLDAAHLPLGDIDTTPKQTLDALLDDLGGPHECTKYPGISVDPALLVLTSGSSGAARAVTASHDNVLFSVAAIQRRLGYQRGDAVGLFVPLSFDYGLYQVLLALTSGASLHLDLGPAAGPSMLGTIAKRGIDVLPLMPGLIAGLSRLAHRPHAPKPAIRLISSTGEALHESAIGALEATFPGARVFAMYGLTECKRVSIRLPEERAHAEGSVGRALDDTEVFAVSDKEERLAAGETGELVVRGRHVTLGYWGAPDATARRFRALRGQVGLALFTGDRGSVDGGGFIRVEGRADALVKHRGFRMSLGELEGTAETVHGVIETGALRTDADELVLFVRLDEAVVDAAMVLETLRKNLDPFKLPDALHIVDALPRTPHGKVDRAALAVQHAQKRGA